MLAPVKGLSLHYRIPMLVSILLFLVMAVFIVVSYFSIRQLEGAGGRQRLTSLIAQAGGMLSESINDIVKTTRDAAATPAVHDYMVNRSPASASAAMIVLNQYAGSGRFEYAMLLNENLQVLLVSAKADSESVEKAVYLPVIKDKSLNAGNIYRIADTVYYPVIAPVMVLNEVRGYLVRSRQVKVTSKVLDQFSSLAGKGMMMLVGNSDGSLWTDLSKPVDYQLPVSDVKPRSIYQYHPEGRQKLLGAFDVIAGTPWIVTMEVPRALIMQASSGYLQWMTLVAVLLIAAGSFFAWYLGRKLTQPLEKLSTAIKAIGSGDQSPEVAVDRRDEVGVLAQSFNRMTAQLKQADQNTQQQIRNAESLNQQLRRLTSHLNSVREEERVSIARELHDHLGQVFAGFRFDVHSLKKRLQKTDDAVVTEKLETIDASITEGVSFVRKLSSELRAGPLEDLGLVAALNWYADNFYQRSRIPVDVEAVPSNIELPLPLATAIFRIFQESLTNIARHAQATRVDVILEMEAECLRMRIIDNGKGFIVKRDAEGVKTLGLLGMKERAIMIRSNLDIHSAPNQGCTIELTVPVSEISETEAGV